ncbi:MAG TPA: type II toxin-antitoxin system ParD family antitoxin [Bryobacteraceae bacterium]|jgi:antitoxin ParD1/3/4
MPRRSVTLTDELNRFIDAEVKSGRFSNASEVVREGLRLMETRERDERNKLAWLRQAVKEGLDQVSRGEGIEIASAESLNSEIDRLDREADAQFATPRKRA